jgi:hypothetical protein
MLQRGGNYVRIVNAGKIIGVDAITGQQTSMFSDKTLTMAFDIFITDSHGNIKKSIPLFAEDYDYMMDIVEQTKSFLLLKKVFADFYGENEVYLNDLEMLQSEITLLKGKLTINSPSGLLDFINQFLDILMFAIENKRTIKFAGD